MLYWASSLGCLRGQRNQQRDLMLAMEAEGNTYLGLVEVR